MQPTLMFSENNVRKAELFSMNNKIIIVTVVCDLLLLLHILEREDVGDGICRIPYFLVVVVNRSLLGK